MKNLAGGMLLFLWLAGCRQSADSRLAAAGEIAGDAPVQAAAQIRIAAPPERVWAVLTGIKDWPGWQRDIDAVAIDGAPFDRARFTWSTGAGIIHSQVALYEPERRFGWTGRLLMFHAIHCWTLTKLPGGGTLVETRESMNGWLIGWFYSSSDLLDADQRWLRYLKKQAEALPHSP